MTSLRLIASYDYNSSRFSTSTGFEAGSFSLVNIKAIYSLPAGVELSAGANNLFDRNYQLTEGFPEEGRSVFVSLTYRY